MSSFNSQNFKIGPCAIVYKGDVLGVTQKTSSLNFKATYHEVTCARAYKQSLEKHLTSLKITFSSEIMEIDKSFDLFLDGNGGITLEGVLGERQKVNGGELLIIPINPQDTTGYRFPKAIMLYDSKCSFNENEEHTFRLEFEAYYEDGVELLFEKFTVSEAQRVTLTNTNDIEPASFERAMTEYIAAKMNMTVDSDIFRGEIPVNIDGCAVALIGKEKQNDVVAEHYEIRVSCIDNSRDNVMEIIHGLEKQFPVYGESITLDTSETIILKAILQDSIEFESEIADSGKHKTLGELKLEVII